MMNTIIDHEFYDPDIKMIIDAANKDAIEIVFSEPVGAAIITREDAVAIAKHFNIAMGF